VSKMWRKNISEARPEFSEQKEKSAVSSKSPKRNRLNPSAPKEESKPPPYTPFCSESLNGRGLRAEDEITYADSTSSTASPGRAPEVVVHHHSVVPTPLLVTPDVNVVPLASDFGRRRRRESTVSEVDSGKTKHPLAVLDPLDYVQLTREGSGPGLDFCLRNAKGDRVLTAAEEVACCAPLFLGRNAPFDFTVCDPAFTEVFSLSRPWSCNSRFFPCCLPRLDVSTPSLGAIGVVKMRWTAFDQHLTIHDAQSDSSAPLCHLKRRRLPLVTRGANEFKIFDPSGKNQIGKIHSRRCSTSGPKLPEDRLAVSFPKSLDSRIKATLVGALFLLRELYFRP